MSNNCRCLQTWDEEEESEGDKTLEEKSLNLGNIKNTCLFWIGLENKIMERYMLIQNINED